MPSGCPLIETRDASRESPKLKKYLNGNKAFKRDFKNIRSVP
jgi:hypothetical protein